MNYFQNIPLFSGMTSKDQEDLSDFCQLQTLQAGQVLFSQGDEAQALYIVQSWALSVMKDTKKIAELWFWDIVGEMSFFWHPPVRNASVIAQGEAKLITLLHYSLTQILQKYPNIHTHLKKIIEERTMKNTQK